MTGRKATAYGPGGWARFALHLILFHRQAVRDEQFAAKWYKVDR